ncbi:methylmalonyl Co-A mutase-associated GTPase MeaB [Dyadobacter aurulentus]|uniref:methylmalonyl Co-A mutase-associated GTPase MeaB n=1 Tax=Dyadobacter sp. UC 10 TaxID=2605428 RepID=UPI0011F3DBCE|nr:methylmalonyl Co-A mutase-associated GTPase MeaB [Dyadobacter sp. UC 10]KAA0990506.1 methylmalonyl Co-A mutase-associated GTPase MeaB [Dyadobacter sp. UC 10]
MRERLSSDTYIDGILAGDRVVLSRAITVIESRLAEDKQLAQAILNGILPHSGNSLRIGITGIPGVGKSTFIEALGMYLTGINKKVAVLAVDPTSSKSAGSILGDKTRMEELVKSPIAFIRPSATGLSLGGVARNTREAMLLCEAAGYEVILIETVGVGQSEIIVKGMTDFFLLLALPRAGDELQGIKKGIVEMANAVVVNKADGLFAEEAAQAVATFQNALHLAPGDPSGTLVQVLACSALENKGIREVWEVVQDYFKNTVANGFFTQNRAAQQVDWMHELIRQNLNDLFYQNKEVRKLLPNVEAKVGEGKMLPAEAAQILLNMLFKI